MTKITRKNTAVVLIDHQVGLLTGVRDMTTQDLEHNVVHLAKAAKVLGIPVVVTNAATDFWGPTIPGVGRCGRRSGHFDADNHQLLG